MADSRKSTRRIVRGPRQANHNPLRAAVNKCQRHSHLRYQTKHPSGVVLYYVSEKAHSERS